MLHPRIWKDPLGYNTAYGMGVNRTTEMSAIRTVIAPLAYADRRISKPRSKMELVELERSARRETVHSQIWFTDMPQLSEEKTTFLSRCYRHSH